MTRYLLAILNPNQPNPRKREIIMGREMKPYDILQVLFSSGEETTPLAQRKDWEDYSTLRDEGDFHQAKVLVALSTREKAFRVISGNMPDRGSVIL